MRISLLRSNLNFAWLRGNIKRTEFLETQICVQNFGVESTHSPCYKGIWPVLKDGL